MDHDSAPSLPPGFRFQPNDQELAYYLKAKLSGKPLDFEPIAVVDVYNYDPWDLPSKSRLKTRDGVWYFFSALERYGNGSRIKRTTEKGYWKTTGKDREVRHNSRTVGMKKKFLVFYTGRAPRGVATNWIMHEYRLVDKELEKAGVAVDALVLVKFFQKSGTAPKNGKASFGEEDDMGVGEEAATEEAAVGDGKYVKAKDLDQSNNTEYSGEFCGDYQQPIIDTGETSELRHFQEIFDIPEQDGMDANALRDDFFEAKDLSDPIEGDPADVDMAGKCFILDMDEGFDPSDFFVD
ncbi:NAC domain-containing protein 78-like isoform X2 [Alnus glutinosa]|uniref:NAC domain-containing protein 78-like isoform X2 n=1 Tax=Alnus glutinosa TaxID=3517 RepID=UPI002D76A4DE|nr:NAC domain-containing protein 78-like isoform X2 [Alnus glutinosa]